MQFKSIYTSNRLRKYTRAMLLSSVIFICGIPNLANAETLSEAVQRAIEHNPQIDIAIAQLEAAEQMRKEERSGYFPIVRAGLAGGRVYGDNSTSRGLSVTRDSAYSYLWEGNLALTQPVFDGMRTLNRHGAAKERLEAAKFSKDDVQELLTLETSLAYLDVLRARKAKDMAGKYLEAMNRYRGHFTDLLNQGAVDRSDKTQAEDMIEGANIALIEFESQERRAAERYKFMTATLPGDDIFDPLSLKTLPDNIDNAVALALEMHPQIRAAIGASNAAWHDAEAEKAALFPTLDGELSYYQKDQSELIGGEVVDARALMRMNWEFSTGGAEIAKFKRGRKNYQEAISRRRDLENNLTTQVREAWINLDKLRKQQEIIRRRLNLTKTLLSTRRTQFEGGQVPLLDLMQAHDQYYNSELENIQVKYAQESAVYGLLGNMGMLHAAIQPQIAENQAVKSQMNVEAPLDADKVFDKKISK